MPLTPVFIYVSFRMPFEMSDLVPVSALAYAKGCSFLVQEQSGSSFTT